MIVKNDAVLEVKLDGKVLRSSKKNHVQPSEMITLTLGSGRARGRGELRRRDRDLDTMRRRHDDGN